MTTSLSRETLDKQIEEFFAKGGKVEKIPTGVTGDQKHPDYGKSGPQLDRGDHKAGHKWRPASGRSF